MSHLVVLDNEAVQALAGRDHPQHRFVLDLVQVAIGRKRRAVQLSLAVPTAVRAEAGWDRNSPAWEFINTLRIGDVSLDASQANIAARIRRETKVSVADAHIGSVVQASPAVTVTVVTSDPDDIRRVAGARKINVVTI
jgi:predicted nucleic acid-binding protein